MRNRIARQILDRERSECPNCGAVVQVGQECIDHTGIREDWGWFQRFHRQCFELMEDFTNELCDGGFAYPFDLKEAAEHALAHGGEEFWRAWLYKYEETWAFSPEPPDPVKRWVKVKYFLGKLPPVPRLTAKTIWVKEGD
jgi:hypothetical protein